MIFVCAVMILNSRSWLSNILWIKCSVVKCCELLNTPAEWMMRLTSLNSSSTVGRWNLVQSFQNHWMITMGKYVSTFHISNVVTCSTVLSESCHCLISSAPSPCETGIGNVIYECQRDYRMIEVLTSPSDCLKDGLLHPEWNWWA